MLDSRDHRATLASTAIDSYGIQDGWTASALVGNQGFTGEGHVVFHAVNKLGLVKTARAVVQRIPYNNGGEVNGLTPVSTLTVKVINDQVTVPFTQTDANDAYLVTISTP